MNEMKNMPQEFLSVSSIAPCGLLLGVYFSLAYLFWGSRRATLLDLIDATLTKNVLFYFSPVTIQIAFESLYGGQLTLSAQLIKPNYLFIYELYRSVLFREYKGLLISWDYFFSDIKATQSIPEPELIPRWV